jgi:putative ABC transport system permease protein
VIAALAATGGLMVQTAGFLHSSERAIYDWVEERIDADLFVTSGSSVLSGVGNMTMDEELGKKIAGVSGVEAVMGVRFHRIDFRNRMVYVIGLDTRAFEGTAGDRPLTRTFARYPQLREPGKVLVSENFAALYGVKVGETIEVRGKDRTLRLEVLGTVVDYTWNRGTIIMDLRRFQEDFGDRQIEVFDVFLAPGAPVEQVQRDIQDRWGAEYVLVSLTRSEFYAELHAQLQRVYSMAYAQQSVVGLVALLGVVSALFISVLQRRRELGLLRAVGASRTMILRSVLAEAVLMGVIGALVGFLIGLVLEWYVIDLLLLDEAGFTYPVRVPWVAAGVVAALSVLSATLAGLWPAYQATKLRIPEAIAYE